MNIYHDIPAGTADEMNVIVEVPKGSSNKYELDKETGLIALDRANYSAASYPCEYAFVPRPVGRWRRRGRPPARDVSHPSGSGKFPPRRAYADDRQRRERLQDHRCTRE